MSQGVGESEDHHAAEDDFELLIPLSAGFACTDLGFIAQVFRLYVKVLTITYLYQHMSQGVILILESS